MKLKKSYIGTQKCMDMDEKPNEGYIIVMILHQKSFFYYYPHMLVNFRLFWYSDFSYPAGFLYKIKICECSNQKWCLHAP